MGNGSSSRLGAKEKTKFSFGKGWDDILPYKERAWAR